MSQDDLRDAHQLLRRSCSDVAALETLYTMMAPAILRWLRARVADSEVAKDLLGETFAQVVCSVDRYRGDSDEAAVGWVWAIARNLLRRYYRQQKVEASARQRLGIVDVEKTDTPAQWTAPDLAVGERLQAALEDLPVQTRESVWLRVVDELPYDEIASRQGCSLTAARQRVSRGMRRLAVVMGGT